MKRNQHGAPNKPRRQTRVIEPGRLAEARGGGGDLGTPVSGGTVTADYISPQHNETLIEL